MAHFVGRMLNAYDDWVRLTVCVVTLHITVSDVLGADGTGKTNRWALGCDPARLTDSPGLE